MPGRPILLRLDAETEACLTRYAQATGLTRQDIIRRAITRLLADGDQHRDDESRAGACSAPGVSRTRDLRFRKTPLKNNSGSHTLRWYSTGPWISGIAPYVAPSTLAAYRQSVRSWLPLLGDVALGDLTRDGVQAAVTKMAEVTTPTQVRVRVTVLRQVLREARLSGHMVHDPAEKLRLPRVPPRTEATSNVLTAEELRRVLAALPPKWRRVAGFLALTGLRWGTVTALRWSDVDQGAGVIHLRRSQYRGRVKDGDKTGHRTQLPLTEGLRRLLPQRPEGPGDGYVFPARGGGPMTSNSLAKPLRRALARAGVGRNVTIHGLRRTWVTLSRGQGEDYVGRAIVGHATEAMTDRYTWVTLDQKAALLDKVASLVTPGTQPADKARRGAGVYVGKRGVAPKAPKTRK